MDNRVTRLLDKAEKAIDQGEYEQGYNYVNIADTALNLRRLELDGLRASFDAPDGPDDDREHAAI